MVSVITELRLNVAAEDSDEPANEASPLAVLPVADRGFGDHKLYQVLNEELRLDCVIRSAATSTRQGAMARRTATGWVGTGGCARVLRGPAGSATLCGGPGWPKCVSQTGHGARWRA
jgi:hypothetical protein